MTRYVATSGTGRIWAALLPCCPATLLLRCTTRSFNTTRLQSQANAGTGRTILGQARHAQASLVQLHAPLVVVLLHAVHRGLVQLQVAAKRRRNGLVCTSCRVGWGESVREMLVGTSRCRAVVMSVQLLASLRNRPARSSNHSSRPHVPLTCDVVMGGA